ncbi:F0F1 ATP synthase subunit gamma [Microcystis aeruginosa]|uniref:ATP synthase gamma subunit-like protein n=1 Tax=Microcystis aeruginosa PCC 9443 TaxID=1160281 RepID=I4G5B2_MICAE|nr:F0F1 ATP synthase subunit gamma [Microcystis aeruginosa]CCI03123.1 ATP synthase gamma subunit-like protein [Microcystis aeruginosa PCC 9443]
MPVLELLQRRIAIAQELQSVVKTMKVLAAASIHQYEQAVESLIEYNRTIEMGLQIVLGSAVYQHHAIAASPRKLPRNSPLGAIIFGSDQGMCGQFNEQIVRYAVTQIQHLSIDSSQLAVLAVGARVIPPLENAGIVSERNFAMPTSLAGITSMVQELLLHIEMWQSQMQIDKIALFYHKPRSNISYQPHALQLLPVDNKWLQDLQQKRWVGATLPTFTMDWSQLFSALIEQYLFICLYRALAESLASENASRLASMQASEKNIEEQLAQLHAQFQQERQTAITEEMLEIVSGFEALIRVC